MGYKTPEGDGLQVLVDMIKDLKRQLRDLQRPTGTSIASLVRQVQIALANITTTVTNAIQSLSYTKAEIDSRIANPGNVSASGSISAAGNMTASGRVISAGIINSPGSRGFQTTVGYVSAYLDSAGDLGFAPSTLDSKQDLVPWAADIDRFMGIGTTKFRYKEAVEVMGADAPVETGLLADDFVAAGLDEFTFNDADGNLAGLAYERLSVILWSVVQQQETRIRDLEQKLASGAND